MNLIFLKVDLSKDFRRQRAAFAVRQPQVQRHFVNRCRKAITSPSEPLRAAGISVSPSPRDSFTVTEKTSSPRS
jgi:hypothetical protein